jgi:hypothetical protein
MSFVKSRPIVLLSEVWYQHYPFLCLKDVNLTCVFELQDLLLYTSS